MSPTLEGRVALYCSLHFLDRDKVINHELIGIIMHTHTHVIMAKIKLIRRIHDLATLLI